MKLVDLNVLIYATDETAAHHAVAKDWLDRSMSSSETIGIPTAVAVGYVRRTTSPGSWRPRSTPPRASAS